MTIECCDCGPFIPLGESYMNLTYSVEHEVESGVIQVDHADSFLDLCEDCAPSKEAVKSALRNAGIPVP
jgi:hypothetical protein